MVATLEQCNQRVQISGQQARLGFKRRWSSLSGQVHCARLQREEPSQRAQHCLFWFTPVKKGRGSEEPQLRIKVCGALRPGSGPGRGLLTQGAGDGMHLGAVGATSHTQGAEQDGACGSGLSPLSRRELTRRRAKGIPPAPTVRVKPPRGAGG